MLPHYSPLKVAETFSMFAGLFPGRIDLGLGRAPGSDPKTAYALQRDRRQPAPDDFPEQLVELLAYLEDTAAGRSSVPRAGQASGPAVCAGALPARLLAAERHLGGAARAAVRLRRLHQPAGRGDRRALPRGVHPVRDAAPSRAPSSRSGRSRRRATRRRSACRRAIAWRCGCSSRAR